MIFDNYRNRLTWIILLVFSVLWFQSTPASSLRRDFQVNANNDDAEENASTGAMSLSSTDLELISDGGTAQIVGIRFRDVSIPQGTTVVSAVLEFETDETNSGSTSLTIEHCGLQ